MNWSDEWWVKVYTRDEPDWMMLSLEAQSLFVLLLRKVSRAGRIDSGRHGRSGVFLALGHAHRATDWDQFLAELEADGCVLWDGRTLTIPNFIEAQAARTSERIRKKRSVEYAEAAANLSELGSDRHTSSQHVTPSHTSSHPVTIEREEKREKKEEATTMSDDADRLVLELMKPSGPKPEALMEAWNANRGELAKATRLTDGRRKHAIARLRDRPLDGPEGWVAIIRRMAASDICNARAGTTGWKADFDFLLKPDTYVKALEGKYDNRTFAPRPTQAPARDGTERRVYTREDALKIE